VTRSTKVMKIPVPVVHDPCALVVDSGPADAAARCYNSCYSTYMIWLRLNLTIRL
jgi:hypothetical protein